MHLLISFGLLYGLLTWKRNTLLCFLGHFNDLNIIQNLCQELQIKSWWTINGIDQSRLADVRNDYGLNLWQRSIYPATIRSLSMVRGATIISTVSRTFGACGSEVAWNKYSIMPNRRLWATERLWALIRVLNYRLYMICGYKFHRTQAIKQTSWNEREEG